MKKAKNRFWDFHYVGFGSAPVAFGAFDVVLDVRGWEAVCSPANCGTEAWCWFLENDPELRNGRRFSTNDYSRREMQRQRKAVVRDVREAFRKGRWGRFVAFTPGGRYGRLRAYLYLRPDGTGYFRGIYCDNWLDEEPIEFTWQPAELALRATRDILTAPIVRHKARWEAFCRHVLDEQIAPHFADPLVARAALIDKPLLYLCGSEAELERVTTWICHCHDDQDTLLANGHIAIVYISQMEGIYGGLWAIDTYALPPPNPNDNGFRYAGYTDNRPLCPPHLKTLLDLAFQHNTFEGHTWQPRRGRDYVKECCRKGDWQINRPVCRTRVIRPSAHERAEALLRLFDWLEGKVPPEQQRALLGLED